MKRAKKLLVAMLCITMLFTMSPAYVFAADTPADTTSEVSQDVGDEPVVINEEEGAAAATPALANEAQDPEADQNHTYEMGKDVPIQSFTIGFTIDSVKYILKATKDASGNTVIEGMDKLKEKYPDGIPADKAKAMNVNMGLYFDPSSINEPKKGDTIEYDLTDVIKVSGAISGKVYNDDGTVVIATYEMGTNGHIKFTLGDSSDGFKDGSIKFGAKLDTTKKTQGGEVPVIIGGMEIDIPIKPDVVVEKCEYNISKAAWNPVKANTGAYIGEEYNSATKKFEQYAVWRIKVNTPSDNTKTVTGVVVSEGIPDGYGQYIQKNADGSPRIEMISGSGGDTDKSHFTYNSTSGKYEWAVPDIAKNSNKYLYVKVWLNDKYTGQELKNAITAARPGENPKTASATLNPSNNLQLAKTVKTPYYNEKGELCAEYTVYVSSKANSMDLYDAIVTDSFGDDAKYIKRIEKPQVFVRSENKASECDVVAGIGTSGYQDIPYEKYNGKYNDKSNLPYVKKADGGAPIEYPDSLTVDNDKKEIKWTVDRIPAIGSENSNIYSRPGSRLIKYIAVIDEDKAKSEETDGVQNYHGIKNTAVITYGTKTANSSANLNIQKKWLKKIGTAANDVGRKGAVKYDITLQENLVVNGNYTLTDTLGAGAEYFDPNMSGKRSVTITRDGDSKKVIVPLKSGEPVTNADGSKTYTSTVTSGDKTYTLRLTENKPDGSSSFELDVPQTDGKKYTVTYYAAPTSSLAIGDISNGAGYGPEGDPTIPHKVNVITEVSDNVFIEKTNTGLNESTHTLSWKATIAHDVKSGTTVTDTINNNNSGKSEFTDEQINSVVVKQGDNVISKDKYTITKNSETSFTVKFNATIKASDANPITIECESVAKGMNDIGEGGSLKYANDVKLVYDKLEATDGAEKTYTKRTHLSKVAGDISIEDGKAYMTWYVKVNQDNDMQGDAIVTDVLTSDQKFVSAEKDNSRSGANAKATTISASSKTNAEGRDEVTINIKDLNNEADSKLVIALKTQIVDPSKLAKTGEVKLENEAKVEWDGGDATAYAETKINNKAIDKTSAYNSSTAPFIEYSVVLNEHALDLNPGGDFITVVDEFDPRLDFKRATFKLTKADGTEIGPEVHNLTVDKANSLFVFVIPDGQKINVEYKCVPSGSLGDTYKPKAFNKMSFYGIDGSEIKQETDITITEGDGDISLVKSFSIYKYTEKGSRLPGAKFELASVTVDADGNLAFNTEETKATGDNGVAKFYGKNGQHKGLEEQQVYAYREIEAPAGYFITPENAEYKFFAFSSKALTDEFKAAFAKKYPDEDVTTAVRINNSSSYTTDVENTKGKITVEKAFANAPAPDGTYYFGLFNTATETKATRVGNIVFHDGKAMNTLVFDELEFGVNGAPRTYYVYECDANGGKLAPDAQGRITINGNKYEVSGDGAVVVEGTEEGYASKITITNAAEISCPIDGTKALTGKDLEKDKFRFALLGVEGTDTEGVKVEATNTAAGKISFGEFRYTKAGEYKYTVHEVKGNDDTITYDETLYNVTVTVAINKGKMTATPSYKKVVDGVETDADAIAFVNKYSPKSTTWVAHAAKTLNGADLEKAQFTFELKGVAGTNTEDVDLTAQNTAEGSVTFEELKYDKAGTYNYTITETAKTGDYVYDSKTYDVVVTVVDNNGQLKATEEYKLNNTKVDSAAFINKVKPTEYVFEAEKILKGRTLKADMFDFTLSGETITTQTKSNDAQGHVTFDKVAFDAAGEYTFHVSEVIPADKEPGFTYDGTNYTATVNVVNDNGQLKVDSVEYNDGTETAPTSITFTNEYEPQKATKQLFAQKTLKDKQSGDKMRTEAGYFTFELTEVDEAGKAIGDTQTKTNNDGGVVTFDAIEYTRADAGVHHYQIKETNFREWEPGDGYLAFAHLDYDETIHNITVTVTDNQETGKLDVTESREDTTKYVDGKYQFTNYYSERPHDPRGEMVLVGQKTFENGDLNDVKFHFTLSEINEDGTERLIGEEVTDNQGGFDFTVAYNDEKDARDEPHHLVLREVVTDDADQTIDYDIEDRKIDVQVTRISPTELKVVDITAGDDPTYHFTNYKMIPCDFTPEGLKIMDLRGAKAGEFEFAIVEKDGTGVKPVAGNEKPVSCNDKGEFKFNKIEYTKTTDAGTHVYQIKEVPGKNKLIGYDDSMIEVTVNVVNDGKGHLLIDGEPTYKRIALDGTETALDEITFENEMNPLNIEVGLKAYKELWYRPDETNPEADQRIEKLHANEFTFAVLDDNEEPKVETTDGEPQQEPQEEPEQKVLFYGTNDEDGQITFADTLKYSKADINKSFNYKVVEVKGNDEHVTYDDVVFKIKVNVSYDAATDRLVAQVFDENNNPLEATVTDTDGVVYEPVAEEFAKLVFDNTYTPDPVGAAIEADKKLIGKKLKAGEFTFQLLDTKTGAVIGTTTNDANGYIVFPFGDGYFTKVGTYEYTIVEVKGNDKNVTYDDKAYRVAVEVTFDADRHLVSTVKYLDGKAVFKNKYNSPKTGDNMPIIPLIGMMIASLLGIGGVTFTRRRKDV